MGATEGTAESAEGGTVEVTAEAATVGARRGGETSEQDMEWRCYVPYL